MYVQPLDGTNGKIVRHNITPPPNAEATEVRITVFLSELALRARYRRSWLLDDGVSLVASDTTNTVKCGDTSRFRVISRWECRDTVTVVDEDAEALYQWLQKNWILDFQH